MSNENPVVYVLINPAFPQLVKIGYTKNLQKRIKALNYQTSIPTDFHCYAAYYCGCDMDDLKVHKIIDTLNPSLRVSKNREFYQISPSKAYNILNTIASINGCQKDVILNPLEDVFIYEYLKNEKDISDNSEDNIVLEKIMSVAKRNATDYNSEQKNKTNQKIPTAKTNQGSLSKTLSALSDGPRRKILSLLKQGRLSAGEIVEKFDISWAAISRHLSVLKEADLIRDEREGKFIFYELNTSVLEDVLCWIAEIKGDEENE